MMKKNRTQLPTIDENTKKKNRFAELDPKDLRRTVGGLRASVTTGASTFNCDDWCDCD